MKISLKNDALVQVFFCKKEIERQDKKARKMKQGETRDTHQAQKQKN